MEYAQGLYRDFDYYVEGKTTEIYIYGRYSSTTVSGYQINKKSLLFLWSTKITFNRLTDLVQRLDVRLTPVLFKHTARPRCTLQYVVPPSSGHWKEKSRLLTIKFYVRKCTEMCLVDLLRLILNSKVCISWMYWNINLKGIWNFLT